MKSIDECKMKNGKCKMMEVAAKTLRNFTLYILHLTLLCGAFAALADEPAAPIVAETLFEDGSTNTWTAADLQTALGLMNRKYHREQETAAGRLAWHGRRMGQYVIETGEDGTSLVELYEDGFVWTNAAKRVTRPDPEAAAKARAAAEARQAEWERTHLPPDVAALLAARRAAATTNEVTVIVTP